MRPQVAASLAVALLALVVPPPVNGASTAFLGAELSVQYHVNTADMKPYFEKPVGGVSTESVVSCHADGQGTFQNLTSSLFRYEEDSSEKGCAEARFRFPVPRGTKEMTVHFTATRTVYQAGLVTNAPSVVNFTQELRTYYPNGQSRASLVIFPDTSILFGNKTTDFTVRFQDNEDADIIDIGWYFADRDRTTPNIPSQQRDLIRQVTQATVSNATVTFTGIPLPTSAVSSEESRSAEGADLARQTLTVVLHVDGDVLKGLRVALPAVYGMAVKVQEAYELAVITGPVGAPLPKRAYADSTDQQIRVVALTPVAAQTASPDYGEYRFTFTAAEALTANVWMALLVGIMLILPAVMAGLSVRQWVHLRRQAGTSYPHIATQYLWAILVAQAIYVVVLFWIFVTLPFPLIVSWPPQSQAVLLLGIMLACTVAFFALAFLAKGRLVRLAEADLATKRRANLELERSNRDLEQFAYVASHDLQEPLRAVAGYTQLLQHRYGSKLDPQAKEYIQHAVEGADRMLGLIHGLLAYARIGTDTATAGPVDLAGALGEALHNLELPLKESGGRVTHGNLPTVHADRPQVVQLLQNLVGNALKFHTPGRPPRIHVEAREAAAGEFTVEVRDNGIGIPPEHQTRIFQIFQRLHPRDRYPGSGLGLAICQRIVERHGGRIWVESKAGQGARFLFTLPKAAPGRAAA